MQDWKTYKLEYVLQIKNGKTKPKETGEIPIYGGNGILGYCNKSNLDVEAILIGRVGAYCGAVYYENREVWVSDNSLYGVAKNGFNTIYLYYLLTWSNLNRFSTGSSQPLLTQSALNVLEFKIAPLEEQIEIASVLSSIDDKIELNLQMNKTLEEMAMALYKHWFLDFGPFQNGKFIDSELGLIPEGWEVKRLDEVAVKKSTTFNFREKTDVVFVNTGDVQEGRFLHSNRISKIGLPGQAKKAIAEGDILYSEIRPKNKRFAFVNFDSSDYVVSTKFMIINPKSNILNRLLYRILTMQSMVNNLDSIAEGRSGTFPQITFDAISDVEIILPPLSIQNQFQEIVSAMELNQDELYFENQTLTKLRDTLLPKLISGEVRVKDIHHIVEASL